MNQKRAKTLRAFAKMKASTTDLTEKELYKRLKLVDKGSLPTKENKEQYRQMREEVLNYRRLKRKVGER